MPAFYYKCTDIYIYYIYIYIYLCMYVCLSLTSHIYTFAASRMRCGLIVAPRRPTHHFYFAYAFSRLAKQISMNARVNKGRSFILYAFVQSACTYVCGLVSLHALHWCTQTLHCALSILSHLHALDFRFALSFSFDFRSCSRVNEVRVWCAPCLRSMMSSSAHHIISYHIISYHIISYHIISYHIISYHIISYHIISYHIISYHIMACMHGHRCMRARHADAC